MRKDGLKETDQVSKHYSDSALLQQSLPSSDHLTRLTNLPVYHTTQFQPPPLTQAVVINKSYSLP